MALAILELLAFEKGNVRFNIDTGTNRYYKLKIGRSVQRKYGIDWVDEVIFSSPMEKNDAGGGLLNSAKDISIPGGRFENSNVYAQLFSFKNREGKSPAFSRAIKVFMAAGFPLGAAIEYSPPLSLSTSTNMKTLDTFQSPRSVPCRSYREAYSHQASWEEILGGIVKIAAPLVIDLLRGTPNGAPQNAAAATATAPAGSTGGTGQADILSLLLKTFLGNVPTSHTQSLNGGSIRHNRFVGIPNAELSQPFEVITLASLGALAAAIAPMVDHIAQAAPGVVTPIATNLPAIMKVQSEAYPLLINALNQHRLQMRQENNKLTSGIVSDVNRRMLLSQLVQAQRETPSGGQPGNAVDLNQLIQLLQQVPATPAPATAENPAPAPATAAAPAIPAPTTTTTTTTGAQSLSLDIRRAFTLSSRAVVSFVTADPLPWNGMQKVLFGKNQELHLKIRFDVVEPVPKTPLPKAILKFIFKDGSDQSVQFEKTFKQKDVIPNGVMTFAFTPAELSRLPANKVTTVFAEMRWLNSKTGKESKAVGSAEIVLVNKYFLKEQGKAASTEQELTDMKRFRPFWNKIWETEPLDAASGRRDSEKKYLWDLDVNAKYSVLLSADHEANGLMETKILQGKDDEESLTQRTEGRIKAGIELSLAELNKLASLWEGETALSADKLEAFKTDAFARNNAGEFISHFRLKGKARERGMIWIVPTFKLFEFTLNAVGKTDETGQVTGMTEEKVRFPLPVSARVIGLKSKP